LNKKHMGLLAVAAISGAAAGIAQADPALAGYAHALVIGLAPLAAWLGMTSPKAGAAQ
jgi:hypothetical protein